MANPTYIGKRVKQPRDRAEWISMRGDRAIAVEKADERISELKSQGCKVIAHWGSYEVTLSIWNSK